MRIGHAVLIASAAVAMAACSRHADNDTGQAMAMPDPVSYTADEKTKIQATFPAPYNIADLADGEKQFNRCRSCHTITPDKMNMTGPHLYGLFGRKAATAEGYTYSDAMKAHDVTWDFDTLDTYLASPQTVVKGTKMSYPGVPDPKQRQDLIAYLKLETTPKTP